MIFRIPDLTLPRIPGSTTQTHITFKVLTTKYIFSDLTWACEAIFMLILVPLRMITIMLKRYGAFVFGLRRENKYKNANNC